MNYSKIIQRLARAAIVTILMLSGSIALHGCNILCFQVGVCSSTTSNGDTPGTISLYNVTDFPEVTNANFYFTDVGRTGYQTNLFQELGWTGTYYQDGMIGGSYTQQDPTESTFITDTHNLLYISSHGGVDGPGQSHICLRNCQFNGYQGGGDTAILTGDIPSAWRGPNWLVIDACSVVVPNAGWEHTFGGNLHAIFGYNTAVNGLNTSAMTKFADEVKGYDTAINAWQQAVEEAAESQYYEVIVPFENVGDAISGSGPSHGTSGYTDLSFYTCCGSAYGVTTSAVAHTGPLSVAATLRSETMNESAYMSQYGVAGTPVTTSAGGNLHTLRTGQAFVKHYLASGAVVFNTAKSFKQLGFVATTALSFAQSWLASNGGLPSDAVLTYAGESTYTSRAGLATPDGYLFEWHHGSSYLLGADKISLWVQDDGNFECIHGPFPCSNPTWVPTMEVQSYVRSWRSVVGQTAANPSRRSILSAPLQTSSTGMGAWCAPDIASVSTTANPCDIFLGTPGARSIDAYVDAYVDATTNVPVASTTPL